MNHSVQLVQREEPTSKSNKLFILLQIVQSMPLREHRIRIKVNPASYFAAYFQYIQKFYKQTSYFVIMTLM